MKLSLARSLITLLHRPPDLRHTRMPILDMELPKVGSDGEPKGPKLVGVHLLDSFRLVLSGCSLLVYYLKVSITSKLFR